MGQGCQNCSGNGFRLECMQLFVVILLGGWSSCSRVICASICCHSNVLTVIFRSINLCSSVIVVLSQCEITCDPCNKVKYGYNSGSRGLVLSVLYDLYSSVGEKLKVRC